MASDAARAPDAAAAPSAADSLGGRLTGDALRGSESGRGVGARLANESGGDDARAHKRSKRFLSFPRFVEVMLVADSKMVEHHGGNLQHYLLTLMAIVSLSMSKGRLHDRSSKHCGRFIVTSRAQETLSVSFFFFCRCLRSTRTPALATSLTS